MREFGNAQYLPIFADLSGANSHGPEVFRGRCCEPTGFPTHITGWSLGTFHQCHPFIPTFPALELATVSVAHAIPRWNGSWNGALDAYAILCQQCLTPANFQLMNANQECGVQHPVTPSDRSGSGEIALDATSIFSLGQLWFLGHRKRPQFVLLLKHTGFEFGSEVVATGQVEGSHII